MHEINYLRQELANIIKDQKKDDNKTKLHQLKPLELPVSNSRHDIKTGKTYHKYKRIASGALKKLTDHFHKSTNI
ncbi:hypothetical protein DYY67_2327 [Candidatus Nitrosotalea sp. TS]|uniref:hypothetical protein n=1 Tax=Candidatus Nitrosotalea sp. TS TaxID=2341020 RepID=UPI00140A2C6F|nr:hypothetical protein [Candidatus Nitrosotalea sp. TS]NHI04526.1 hypothetical protein [Candidatus Nitrosotalea sp. TS]